jgi:hypothetical protein
MLVTLNGATFVFIMLRVCVVTRRVERVEYEWDEAAVGASPPWLPVPFPHPAIPTTRKHTTMTNALLVLLLRHIETPLSYSITRGWRPAFLHGKETARFSFFRTSRHNAHTNIGKQTWYVFPVQKSHLLLHLCYMRVCFHHFPLTIGETHLNYRLAQRNITTIGYQFIKEAHPDFTGSLEKTVLQEES